VTIRRRESEEGPRFDVVWRLPDRSKRSKTFKPEREARVFEGSVVTKFAAGDIVEPRAGRVTSMSKDSPAIGLLQVLAEEGEHPLPCVGGGFLVFTESGDARQRL
jgi:hypothetical protein